MRIIGYIPDDVMKITLLEMNHRISIKFEDGFMEQTYKLNIDAGQEGIKDLKSHITPEFKQQILDLFRRMQEVKKGMTSQKEDHGSKFPDII